MMAAKDTFQTRVEVPFKNNAQFTETFLLTRVPDDKQLEIQVIAGTKSLPSGQLVIDATVTTETGGHRVSFDIMPGPAQNFTPGSSITTFFQPLILYADGGTEVTISLIRNATAGDSDGSLVSLSGFFRPQP